MKRRAIGAVAVVRGRIRSAERGQALIEFTLILPVFLLILMGMLEFGSAYDHKTAMAYAVREGARVGDFRGYECGARLADHEGSPPFDA